MLPGALFWGASFPLALASVAEDGQDPGRLVGGVYAANTVGAILGSLGTGLIMVVLFDSEFTQKMLMKMVPLAKLASRDQPWHLVRKEIDQRLPAMSFVIGVEIDGDYCAFPVTALAQSPVATDRVGGQPVAVFYDKAHDIGQAFLSRLGDRDLTFEDASPADGATMAARDRETGSTWNVSGHAIDGELMGSTLKTAPHWNQLFWFSWAAFKPGTRIHGRDA